MLTSTPLETDDVGSVANQPASSWRPRTVVSSGRGLRLIRCSYARTRSIAARSDVNGTTAPMARSQVTIIASSPGAATILRTSARSASNVASAFHFSIRWSRSTKRTTWRGERGAGTGREGAGAVAAGAGSAPAGSGGSVPDGGARRS